MAKCWTCKKSIGIFTSGAYCRSCKTDYHIECAASHIKSKGKKIMWVCPNCGKEQKANKKVIAERGL